MNQELITVDKKAYYVINRFIKVGHSLYYVSDILNKFIVGGEKQFYEFKFAVRTVANQRYGIIKNLPGETYPSGYIANLIFVDWGDGTINRETSHLYVMDGEATITIKCDYAHINFYNDQYLLSILTPLPPMHPETSGYKSVRFMFASCRSLISVPENLFDNCPQLEDFSLCFNACTSLSSPIYNLFDNCPNANNFLACFLADINLTGYAPALWNRQNATGGVCFNGCYNLANYDEIPSNWK